jgi:hypothetical protein
MWKNLRSLAIFLCVGLVFLVSMWLAWQWRREVAIPNPVSGQLIKGGEGPTIKRNSSSIVAIDEVSSLRPQVISEIVNGPAVNLDQAIDAWIKQEQERIGLLEKETFGESVQMMADWNSSYKSLVMDVNPFPALPETARLIVFSRRFAKLVEEMKSQDIQARRADVRKHIDADLKQWKKLYDSGERLTGIMYTNVPGRDTSDLILPLTMRIHAELLLLAQFPSVEDLGVLSQYVDTLGSDVNYGVASFLAQEILAVTDGSTIPQNRRVLLDDYRNWLILPDVQKLIASQSIRLPSYRAAVRPNERASAMGARQKEAVEGQPLQLKIPRVFRVWARFDKSKNVYIYEDGSGGALEASKKAVDFARKLNNASQE